MMHAEQFFSETQKEAIRKAIENAEERTSGEIRVHIENKCNGDVVRTAESRFGKLKMHKTKERNGVLFYLAVESKVFSIYGDKGIHGKVGNDFWKEISALMEKHFSKGEFTKGLCEGIAMAGEKLAIYFPHTDEDKNELTNEISFK
jgi:uncharacterized membrane protein